MAIETADLDACPTESCEADISHAVITTEASKLTTQNMTQDRTCIKPTMLDGEPAFYLIFHDHLEPGHGEPDIPVNDIDTDTDDEPDEPDEDAGDDETEPSRDIDDLGDDPQTVFRRVMENEPIDESSLSGKCLKDDLSPTHVKGIADALFKSGHLDKTDDGKYVTG